MSAPRQNDDGAEDTAQETTDVGAGPAEPITPYSGPVAGMKAVVHGLRYAHQQMGVVRSAQTLLRVNQQDGFDCPGCAWPEPAHRAAAEFCENGARAVAHEATRRTVGPTFFREFSVEQLRAQSDYWLEQQGRLTTPMYKAKGASHYAPISFDDAIARIADALRALPDPNRAVFYTSGRTSNEAAFLYQLFVRQYGTNNFPDCSNMCHESSGTGLSTVIGVGKGTVSLADFEHADAIFVMGQNPGTNHPRMLRTLAEARARGAQIVSVNPIRERSLEQFADPQTVRGVLLRGSPISSLFLQVKIGGDVALLQGIAKLVLAQEERAPGTALDQAFLDEHTHGFAAYREALRAVSFYEIERDTGLSRAQIEEAAQVYLSSRNVIICWAMGLTQHKHGVANIREVVNLLLLRGNLGRPGAGVCPVRGHSNVQGDRTMGIWEKPPAAFLDRLEAVFGFSPPREHGYDTVATLRAMEAGDVSVFFALGGNFARATPDTEQTARALAKVPLIVQVSTKLNRSHLEVGDEALILPCLGRTDRDLQKAGPQFVTVENSMGVVHRSEGRLPPLSDEMRSEPVIVAALAEATLGERAAVPYRAACDDYDQIRDYIAQTLPGFERMNERVRAPDGFVLPNAARSRAWNTATGKAEFTVNALPKLDVRDDELLLMTLRSHDQYNTTLYGLDDRYRGVIGRRDVLLLSAADFAQRALAVGSRVDVESRFVDDTRAVNGYFRAYPFDLPKGCAAAYFPEANALIHRDSVADESHTPTSKSIAIRVRPHVAAGAQNAPARTAQR